MIEVTTAGALTTIQDLGREGVHRYGVGTAGAMDKVALRGANALLANPDGAAGIEVQVFPFEVRFTGDVAFALTGADCNARLDGRLLPPWWRAVARAGSVLALGHPARGLRAYLVPAGGVDVPVVLGSRSTQLRGAIGGFDGRPLQAGDVIGALAIPGGAPSPQDGFGVEPPDLALPPVAPVEPGITHVRVLPAAEHDHFDAASRETFRRADWKITAQSNRYGYRLAGPALALSAPLELRSHGIVPGVVQVPAGGQPIIQLADAQTAGGYPKIATIVEADLWRLAQAPLGSKLRFVETTYAEAVAAGREIDTYIARIRRAAGLAAGCAASDQ